MQRMGTKGRGYFFRRFSHLHDLHKYLTDIRAYGTMSAKRKCAYDYASERQKDIVARKKFPDLAILQSVVRFMFDNVGSLCTTIADTMASTGRKITVHTVENYLSALTDSFVLYKIGR